MANTRGRKGSLNELITLEDIAVLIRESEERMKSYIEGKIDCLAEKITALESSLSIVQSECVRIDNRIDNELVKMQETIVGQQLQIESNETKLRANNLIFHNISEDTLPAGVESLTNDDEKINFISNVAKIGVKREDIVSVQRLGKKQSERNRPLKVIFKNSQIKYNFLNKRKEVITNAELFKIFHQKIFINLDSTFLTQKEEFRLRQKLKKIKNESPETPCFIRSGSLFENGVVIDKIDIRNQLF